MESILMEVLDLQKRGYKEVTLLGQNIDAYGRDQTPKRTFAQLLQYLDSHVRNEDTGDSNFRIRYVTSHPRYFSDKVIDAVANLPSVMECFHVPFQSGDDGVLRDMRRGYTHDSYMHIIQKIRKAAPDASICGDVIVGFPGETEEAFERTLELMGKVKFDNLNTFAYSPRPNTEAALWENKIPEDVKADRLQRVQRLAVQHAMERSERYAGRVVEVLVEGVNPRRPLHSVVGKTRQGRAVFFDGDIQELEGQFCQVHIDEASTWSLMGTHVPNPSTHE
jgi:tRNA-2-methylthio-N6-dimethylallyladenosine synthase